MARINICYDFKEGPWGGGNQFLQTFRKWCRDVSVYAEHPSGADAIVFNSHHMIDRVAALRQVLPDKLYIHRVDGPIRLVRGRDAVVDRIVHEANTALADGTVFQSEWSRRENIRYGMRCPSSWTVIHNTADPSVFHASTDRARRVDGRIGIVASSWSSNPRKGFDVYKYLDAHLDFSKYSMTFIGNADLTFRNIHSLPPMDSSRLAHALRSNDIYLTASINDPCSNSLIEAIQCGLVPVYRQSGGHPELAGDRGILFQDNNDILMAIEQAASRVSMRGLNSLASQPSVAAEKYYEFISGLLPQQRPCTGKLTFSRLCSLTRLRFWTLARKASSRLNRNGEKINR